MKFTTAFLSFLLLVLFGHSQSDYDKLKNVIISQPFIAQDNDWKFEGTQNILFVPENRNDPNSRLITLHFFKFPAKSSSNLPPVAFLGAGPGEPYDTHAFYNGKRAEAWRYEVEKVNQKRDVYLINQRGNSDSPGLVISEFRYKWNNGGSLEEPLDFEKLNRNRKQAYSKYVAEYSKKGIDLKGYDVHHFVDDIEAIRQHFNHNKLAFIGNSFASQWALAYIRKYPQNVDRALFSGVEPLNNNYDDPDGIWKVLELINDYAIHDSLIADDLPRGGVIEAFKTVIDRLEKSPVRVLIEDEGDEIEVVVGGNDLRYNLMNYQERSYKGELESWPKYIMEMYNGDFRFLASISKGRIYNSSARMISPLFNNSLGISAERDKLLQNRTSVKWLGDINKSYTSIRDICPSPVVSDSFRNPVKIDIPIIIIHGDMDLSTPYTNATELMESLENGHLITVKRGSHNAKRALIFDNRELMDQVFQFMDADFNRTSFNEFKTLLPKVYELSEFKFRPIGGMSFYDHYSE